MIRGMANAHVLHDSSVRHIQKRPSPADKVSTTTKCLSLFVGHCAMVGFLFLEFLFELQLLCKSDLTFQSLLQRRSDWGHDTKVTCLMSHVTHVH